MALGEKSATIFKNWDLAVEGSPTTHTLMSPLRDVDSPVVFGTPPNNINVIPRFTSSLPWITLMLFDVAPKRRGLAGGLRDSTKQHQRDPSLHLVVAMDCGEETGDEVVVEVLVLGHLVHALPLLRLHLLLHSGSRFWFIPITAQFRLAIGGHATGKEGHS